MKFTSSLICLVITIFAYFNAHAQEKNGNMFDSAHVYYERKDFKRAAHFFDIYYIEQKKAQSNYDTYFAAVAAAHVGNTERATYYLQRSALVGYDFEEYNFFANDPNNVPLRNLPQWKKFISDFKYKSDSAKVIMDKTIAEINDTTIRAQSSLLNDKAYWTNAATKSTSEQLIKKIKQFNAYLPTKKDNFWSLYQIKANDTLTVPFLVHVPKGYRPTEKTALYIYLHGAIINRKNFTNPKYIPNGLEIPAMTKAMEQNAFIIYPLGKKDFGWLHQQQAFETILKEIVYVKSHYNIDDNKIYVGGHSNGGSGAFWFALNQPSIFASFFGFNYLPKTYYGNTSLRNLNNKTFYGISGSDDSSFPLTLVNPIYQYGVSHGANWKNYVKKGGHSLPFSQRDSINFIFDTLATNIRNPFPKRLEWETDNVKNGRNGWLEIMELDTLAEKASWQTTLNPTATQNGKTGIIDFNKNKSGAVKAYVEGNTIHIESSRVKRVKLYISEDMFDLKRQIKLIINGKDYINTKIAPDKSVILEEFLKTKDRDFIVSNIIEFTIT
ncbi:MAG: hypothetical protein EOO90_05485 [Pedobacter sp.]|nr:MAG: hypothetical protein EOO90_05485 [Pedobacter sp.]